MWAKASIFRIGPFWPRRRTRCLAVAESCGLTLGAHGHLRGARARRQARRGGEHAKATLPRRWLTLATYVVASASAIEPVATALTDNRVRAQTVQLLLCASGCRIGAARPLSRPCCRRRRRTEGSR